MDVQNVTLAGVMDFCWVKAGLCSNKASTHVRDEKSLEWPHRKVEWKAG